MNHELLNFVASKNVADSIRLEASVMPPKIESDLKEVVRQIAETFVDEYGHFMPETSKALLNGIEDRVIFVDSPYAFAEAWFEEIEGSAKVLNPEEVIYFGGFELFHERLSIVRKPHHNVLQELPQAFQEAIVEEVFKGDKKEAKRWICAGFFCGALVEEIVHQFQDWSRSRWLLQCGAVYYTRIVVDRMGLPYFPDSDKERRSELYEKLVRCGDNVHRIFFGSMGASSPDMRK